MLPLGIGYVGHFFVNGNGQVIKEATAGIQRVVAPFAFAVPQFQLQVPVRQSVALNVQSNLFPTADSGGSAVCVLYIRAGQLYGSFGLIGFAAVADVLHIVEIILQRTVHVLLIGRGVIIVIEIAEFQFFQFLGVVGIRVDFRIGGGTRIVFIACLVYPGHEFIKFVVIGVVIVVGFVGLGSDSLLEIGKPLIVVVVVFGSRYSVHSGIARNTRFVDFGHPDVNPYGNDVVFILFKLVFVVGLIAAAGNGVFGVVNQQSCAV